MVEKKAIELVNQYYSIFENDDDEHFIDTSCRISFKCAMLNVDSIIIAIKSFRQIENSSIGIFFWEEVRCFLNDKKNLKKFIREKRNPKN